MKKAKYVIIGIACICLICAGFFIFTQGKQTTEKELTEVEKLTTRDLKSNYPKTPREVVKFYNRIISCYYSEELTDAQIEALADKMLALLDEDLLLVNQRDEYIRSIKLDIETYKAAKKRVVTTDVCDSNEVKYVTDEKEGQADPDKLAYVNTSYFINTNGEFGYTYQQFVLRQDENEHWKILTFYEVEGESSDDE